MGPALWEVLEGVPDRRAASGRRHPLPAIPAIAIAAMLAGRTSLAAIARWGRPLGAPAGPGGAARAWDHAPPGAVP